MAKEVYNTQIRRLIRRMEKATNLTVSTNGNSYLHIDSQGSSRLVLYFENNRLNFDLLATLSDYFGTRDINIGGFVKQDQYYPSDSPYSLVEITVNNPTKGTK